MTEITDDQWNSLLIEFKSRMSIYHSSEDSALLTMLKASYDAIVRMTGITDLTNQEFKQLVIERSRYAYNDQVEFFEDNFLSEIIGLNVENYGKDDDSNEQSS